MPLHLPVTSGHSCGGRVVNLSSSRGAIFSSFAFCVGTVGKGKQKKKGEKMKPTSEYSFSKGEESIVFNG